MTPNLFCYAKLLLTNRKKLFLNFILIHLNYPLIQILLLSFIVPMHNFIILFSSVKVQLTGLPFVIVMAWYNIS